MQRRGRVSDEAAAVAVNGRNVPLAARNLVRVIANRVSKFYRASTRRLRRASKSVRESGKQSRAQVRGAMAAGRDATQHAYSGLVRTSRYWERVRARTVPKLRRELSVRGELRALSRADAPILVGPWLSEVGYEVLYWVPFVRWFTKQYGVAPDRMVAVSRGGVAGWYGDVAHRYVELFDLIAPEEFASRNTDRQRGGDQKQHGRASFDDELLERVRRCPGLGDAVACHPSTMFRLLRQFWLGNDSLEYLLEYTRYASIGAAPAALPDLPPRFTAVKFYTGRALPDTAENRAVLRTIVQRVAARGPVVLLDTGLALDEHEDYLFDGIRDVVRLGPHLTPQSNLGVQTEVIRRAERFVGTCGSLAWLAPMLGTETLAIYQDDHLLTSHLYAARHAFSTMGAAPFTALDLRALALLPPLP